MCRVSQTKFLLDKYIAGLYRFAKASANLVLGLIFTAVAISMLTNMGILPPLDVLFERFKEVISLVRI